MTPKAKMASDVMILPLALQTAKGQNRRHPNADKQPLLPLTIEPESNRKQERYECSQDNQSFTHSLFLHFFSNLTSFFIVQSVTSAQTAVFHAFSCVQLRGADWSTNLYAHDGFDLVSRNL